MEVRDEIEEKALREGQGLSKKGDNSKKKKSAWSCWASLKEKM